MITPRITLPTPAQLESIARGIATLDAILHEDWECRYYSFDRSWAAGSRMASMRDGSGDEWFLVFAKAGVFLKGLAHEHPRALAADIYAGLPATLEECRSEPAFSMGDVTYGGWCVDTWTLRCDARAEEVTREHLEILSGDPGSYQRHASDYFEVDVPLELVRHVYAGRPLTATLLEGLSHRSLETLQVDLDKIGYGVATP